MLVRYRLLVSNRPVRSVSNRSSFTVPAKPNIQAILPAKMSPAMAVSTGRRVRNTTKGNEAPIITTMVERLAVSKAIATATAVNPIRIGFKRRMWVRMAQYRVSGAASAKSTPMWLGFVP